MLPGNPISSHRELVAFHFERSRTYDSLATLCHDLPSRQAALWINASHADPEARAHRAFRELHAALSGTSLEAIATELARVRSSGIPFACPASSHPARRAAFESARLPPNGRATEIETLAVLAQRCHRAMSAGAVDVAAAACDDQVRFISGHAGTCLLDFAAQLEEGPSELYQRVGRALHWAIDDDLLFLGESLKGEGP